VQSNISIQRRFDDSPDDSLLPIRRRSSLSLCFGSNHSSCYSILSVTVLALRIATWSKPLSNQPHQWHPRHPRHAHSIPPAPIFASRHLYPPCPHRCLVCCHSFTGYSAYHRVARRHRHFSLFPSVDDRPHRAPSRGATGNAWSRHLSVQCRQRWCHECAPEALVSPPSRLSRIRGAHPQCLQPRTRLRRVQKMRSLNTVVVLLPNTHAPDWHRFVFSFQAPTPPLPRPKVSGWDFVFRFARPVLTPPPLSPPKWRSYFSRDRRRHHLLPRPRREWKGHQRHPFSWGSFSHFPTTADTTIFRSTRRPLTRATHQSKVGPRPHAGEGSARISFEGHSNCSRRSCSSHPAPTFANATQLQLTSDSW
jgi:hypothetical protein